MTSYRLILKQAFAVAWQHKYLWFFGLFATLLSSNFEFQLLGRFLGREEGILNFWYRWSNAGFWGSDMWRNLAELARIDPVSFVQFLVVTLIVVGLFALLVWLSVVSQVALVSNSAKALAIGRRLTAAERTHDMAIGFQEGRTYFWPALGLNIAVYGAVYLLALLSVAPLLIWGSDMAWVNALYWILFMVMVVLALSAALAAKYAIAYVVIKRQPFAAALRSGIRLFKANWLVSLEMAFILFALSLLGTIVILVAVFSLAIPFTLLAMFALMVKSTILYFLFLILSVLALIGVIVIGGATITVIQTNAWVNLFNQLLGKKVESKLERAWK